MRPRGHAQGGQTTAREPRGVRCSAASRVERRGRADGRQCGGARHAVQDVTRLDPTGRHERADGHRPAAAHRSEGAASHRAADGRRATPSRRVPDGSPHERDGSHREPDGSHREPDAHPARDARRHAADGDRLTPDGASRSAAVRRTAEPIRTDGSRPSHLGRGDRCARRTAGRRVRGTGRHAADGGRPNAAHGLRRHSSESPHAQVARHATGTARRAGESGHRGPDASRGRRSGRHEEPRSREDRGRHQTAGSRGASNGRRARGRGRRRAEDGGRLSRAGGSHRAAAPRGGAPSSTGGSRPCHGPGGRSGRRDGDRPARCRGRHAEDGGRRDRAASRRNAATGHRPRSGRDAPRAADGRPSRGRRRRSGRHDHRWTGGTNGCPGRMTDAPRRDARRAAGTDGPGLRDGRRGTDGRRCRAAAHRAAAHLWRAEPAGRHAGIAGRSRRRGGWTATRPPVGAARSGCRDPRPSSPGARCARRARGAAHGCQVVRRRLRRHARSHFPSHRPMTTRLALSVAADLRRAGVDRLRRDVPGHWRRPCCLRSYAASWADVLRRHCSCV